MPNTPSPSTLAPNTPAPCFFAMPSTPELLSDLPNTPSPLVDIPRTPLPSREVPSTPVLPSGLQLPDTPTPTRLAPSTPMPKLSRGHCPLTPISPPIDSPRIPISPSLVEPKMASPLLVLVAFTATPRSLVAMAAIAGPLPRLVIVRAVLVLVTALLHGRGSPQSGMTHLPF